MLWALAIGVLVLGSCDLTGERHPGTIQAELWALAIGILVLGTCDRQLGNRHPGIDESVLKALAIAMGVGGANESAGCPSF